MSVTLDPTSTDALRKEVARRRTFAIISHPDAGKTTLTEKTLLYAGAIELAGRSAAARRSAPSCPTGWTSSASAASRSRRRPSSSSSTTARSRCSTRPGHKDFSEDTLRTLLAVDSVVMVIDAAKGIETQTRKLFEVCRNKGLPMLTFVNKLDLPSRDPFELCDEIERVLQIHAAPVNWPIGDGDRFKGVYDLRRNQVLLYERTLHNARRAGIEVSSIEDPALGDLIGEDAATHLRESAALVGHAGTQVDHEAYLRAEQTPVFFGSALSNFGLEPFLRGLTEFAPPPQPRPSSAGMVDPADPDFSGFVFKIQANMNPKHRDRIAFVRVCSGVLSKDMQVTNARLNAPLRLSRPNRFFGRERETVDSAVAGDVVGLVNPGGSPSATRCGPARSWPIRRSRTSRPSSSPPCGCATRATSSSRKASASWRKKA
jgi:peptide chain release factor 3